MPVHVKETASRLILTGPRDELYALSKSYAVRPPEYWRSPKWELYKKTNGERGWDGFIYPLKVTGSTGILARGHLDDLRNKAVELGVKLDESGVLRRPYLGMVLDDVPTDLVISDYPDYPHQREIVLRWLQSCIGIGEIVVSGGKTRSFCMAASMLKRKVTKLRVLYLVPTERLVSQAFSDAKQFLPDWNITQYGGKKRDNTGDMVIATNAIVSVNFGKLSDWLKSFNVLFVDEAHHASSPTLTKIIEAVPAYFKFGATDCAKEDDPIKGLAIRGLLGPVLSTVVAEPLIDDGHLARPTIIIVDEPSWQDRFKGLQHQAQPGSPAWAYVAKDWKKATYLGYSVERDENGDPRLNKKGETIQLPSSHRLEIEGTEIDVESRWCLLDRAYDRAIIRFKERNELIYAWAKYFSDAQERTLVVATRTLHVLLLQAGLEKVIDPKLVKILFSEHSSDERDEVFQWLKDTPGSVLISPLVKEGVSLPELTAGVIGDYVGSIDVARQLVGRFIRKKRHRESNTAKIVWFVDRQVPSFRRGSLELLRELEKVRGYDFCHPVLGPETLDMALKYESRS